jgi:hypothetical protein
LVVRADHDQHLVAVLNETFERLVKFLVVAAAVQDLVAPPLLLLLRTLAEEPGRLLQLLEP